MSSDFKKSTVGCLAGVSSAVFGFFPMVAGISCFFAGPEIADRAYVFLSSLFVAALVLSVALIPLAFFRGVRPYVGMAYVVFSMMAAAFLSILAINMIAYQWGQHWVLLGLTGPGLPFFGLMADLFSGDFAGAAYLAFCGVALLGWRFGGAQMLGDALESR